MGTGEEGCLANHFKVIIFLSRLERQVDGASKHGLWRSRVLGVVISVPEDLQLQNDSSAGADEFTETPCSPDRQALQTRLLEGEAFVKSSLKNHHLIDTTGVQHMLWTYHYV